MEKYINELIEGAADFYIELSELQIEQFIKYYNYMIEVNKSLNLTRITEVKDVINKHFLDSLALAKYTDFYYGFNVMDLGTGAGFPGIPLKIAFPGLNVTLVDCLKKKVHFLNDVIELLGLKNVQAIHSRAEDLSHMTEYREKYDICVSRAVANLSTLSEYCLPFVKIGGYFIPYKSCEMQKEILQADNAVKELGGNMENTVCFDLSDTGEKRSFLFVKKVSPTNKMYPRKSGTPLKNPLS